MANQICAEYAQQGYDLTLRQLYYQFVARGYIPNRQQEYARLGKIIGDARMAGLLDWNYLVDRTRNLRSLPHWKSPVEILKDTAAQFRHDKWKDQPCRVEVWIEKDALVGVLEAVCPRLDVPYFSCRGYTSLSEMWETSNRLRGYVNDGKKVTVIHLGDHDPSGMDMTRDIRERLERFIATDLMRDHKTTAATAMRMMRQNFKIDRIALNMDQIQHFNPPPNPAKITDSRYAGYVERYGRESWELDALSPDVLVALIEESVAEYRDEVIWAASLAKENAEKELLKAVSTRWEDVTAFLLENEGDAA
jgi:hypothetical protein